MSAIPQPQAATLTPIDEGALLAGDVKQLDLLQKHCIAQGGSGTVQVGKYVINIQHGTNVTIGDGVAPAELLKAVKEALAAIRASDAYASLMQYLEAVKSIRILGQSLSPDDSSHHDRFIGLHAESRGTLTSEPDSTLVRDLLMPGPNGEEPSLWLDGQPGFGKSTLLRHIARSAWYAPESVGLSAPHLPLYARLSCVAQAESAYIGETLKSALGKAHDITTKRPITDEFLDAWSQKMNARWLLLLGKVNKVRTKHIYQTGIRRIYHYFLDLYNSGKSERIEWEHMHSNHKKKHENSNN